MRGIRLLRLIFARPVILSIVALATLALVAGTLWRGDWPLAVLSLLLGLLALRATAIRTDPEADAPGGRAPRREETADLLLASPDPVVTVDRRGVVTAANDAARKLLSAPVKVGEPLAFALRAPEVLGAIRTVAAKGEGQDVEYGGRTPAEPLVAVRLRPLPARGASAVALFFLDRTHERRVETMRVDFIATVSHELRTPLASLTGFIDTIAGPARNDAKAQDRFLGIMREQADRMTRLVDDLLQLSRVELNEHVAPTGLVDLGAVSGHMAEIMAPMARQRGATIRVDLADNLPQLRGDRDQLLRVVENLIANALKYGGAGEVLVQVRRSEDSRALILSVSDKGPGIPPEHIPRLTERFYRVNEAESRARGGTGLGLAIVKHVVGRHRGRLSIESQLGAGTTVSVQLPVVEGAGRPVLP